MPEIGQFVEQIIIIALGGAWVAWGIVLFAAFFDRYIDGGNWK